MSQSIFNTFKDGQDYMNVWPVKKELYALFPECRVVSATKFAIRFMPPLAVLSCAGLVNTFGVDYLPQALTVGIFFISLPMQGLMWLGYRSSQVLPPQLRHWYHEIHSKMSAEGCQVEEAVSKPKYRELAKLLKSAFELVDKSFTRRWF